MAVKKTKKTTKKVKKGVTKKKAFRTGGSGGDEGGGDFYSRMARGREGMKSGSKFFKITNEETTVRFIPFEHDGEMELYAEDVSHVMCHPSAPGNLPCLEDGCPICGIQDEYEQLPQDIADKLRPRKTFNVHVVERTTPGAKTGDLVVWGAPKTVMEKTLGIVCDRTEYPNCLDLVKGRDMKILKTGQKMQTRYDVRPAGSPSRAPSFEGEPVDLIARAEAKLKRFADFDYEEIAQNIRDTIEGG